MKLNVATKDRGEKPARPQTPCPLVHPEPNGVPKPTILDIGMPDMTGYEVARRIRAERWGSNIYLIAVTGWGQKEDKARAIASGFDYHLTKPVDPNEVEKLLHSYFARRAVSS